MFLSWFPFLIIRYSKMLTDTTILFLCSHILPTGRPSAFFMFFSTLIMRFGAPSGQGRWLTLLSCYKRDCRTAVQVDEYVDVFLWKFCQFSVFCSKHANCIIMHVQVFAPMCSLHSWIKFSAIEDAINGCRQKAKHTLKLIALFSRW